MCAISLVDSLLGQVSVPFDLVKKQPKGQQTFALLTKDRVTGSLTTEVRTSSQSKLEFYHTLCQHIHENSLFFVSEVINFRY